MEKKEEQKRKRSQNWVEEDKMLLQELVKKNVKAIENKNTDTNTNQAKKRAWIEIEENFNSLCMGGHRNIIQLKTQWVATKVQARKKVATHRKEILKTGGGTQPKELDVSGNDISVWLPNEFVVDRNEFDSDAIEEILMEDEGCSSSGAVQEIISQITQEVFEEPESAATPESTQTKDCVPPRNRNIPSSKQKKKIQKEDTNSSTSYNITKLTEFDMKCRRELHELRVEAEKKRIRNLDREFDLIELKISSHKNNNNNNKNQE